MLEGFLSPKPVRHRVDQSAGDLREGCLNIELGVGASREDRTLYLQHGALEVWLVVEDGAIEIQMKAGAGGSSTFGFDP